MVKDTKEKVAIILQRMLIAHSIQKSYTDKHCRELKFKTVNKVFVKVSQMKGFVRFDKKEKLNPQFIGPFDVAEKVG